MKKVILEEYSENWVYMQLHMFKRGVIEAKDITDPLISYIKPNGVIKLKFSSEKDYFDLFDLPTYDKELASDLYAMYPYFEHYSLYQGNDDWKYGYIFRFFNDDNMNLLRKISSIIYPIENFENENEVAVLSDRLYELFQSEVGDIISDYCIRVEESIREGLKETIEEELCNIFQSDKILAKVCFLTYYTTVDVLISLYDKYGKKNITIYDLLKLVGEQKDVRGDYGELVFDYQHRSFDDNEFNKSVERYLEYIMEKIEDSDIFLDVKEYGRISNELSKKFKFEKMYKIPKNEGYFYIKRIEPETNKIVIATAKSTKDKEKIVKYSLDDFNNFLYQPELNLNFDN